MKTEKIIPLECRRNKDGTWEVVTSFLKDGVGDYLGKSSNLSEEDCREIHAKWMEMQQKQAATKSLTKRQRMLFKGG